MDLYTKYAEEFSKTRNSFWEGWTKLIPKISEIQKLKVLDIGCGNGRFIRFLVDNNVKFDTYLGVDYSEKLLKIAKENYTLLPNVNFKVLNLLRDWKLENLKLDKFNLIVAFGVTHHLETPESREKFFDMISKLILPDGYIIISFWQFKDNENLFSKAVEISTNLYKLKFGKDATRTCYNFEQEEIEGFLQKYSLEIVEKFYADSKNNRGNEYFILKAGSTTG